MRNRNLGSKISTSIIVGSTLLGLSAFACSGSDAPAAIGAAGASAAAGSAGSAGSASGCPSENLTPPPNVPAILQAPSGTTLVHHFHAEGTQDYKCTATAGAADAGDAGTTYSWVFVAPEAALSDACGNQVGTHYAGPGGAATPRWQYTADGSYVQGMKVQASPVTGSIPELLLAATEASAGTLANVSYVQRLQPVGGAAPAADCGAGNVDELKKSGYSAEYYFYSGSAGAGSY